MTRGPVLLLLGRVSARGGRPNPRFRIGPLLLVTSTLSCLLFWSELSNGTFQALRLMPAGVRWIVVFPATSGHTGCPSTELKENGSILNLALVTEKPFAYLMVEISGSVWKIICGQVGRRKCELEFLPRCSWRLSDVLSVSGSSHLSLFLKRRRTRRRGGITGTAGPLSWGRPSRSGPEIRRRIERGRRGSGRRWNWVSMVPEENKVVINVPYDL